MIQSDSTELSLHHPISHSKPYAKVPRSGESQSLVVKDHSGPLTSQEKDHQDPSS